MGKRAGWLIYILSGALVPVGISFWMGENMRDDLLLRGPTASLAKGPAAVIPYVVGLWGMCLLVPFTPWPVRVPPEAVDEEAQNARWMSRVFRALWYAVGAALAGHFWMTVGRADMTACLIFGAYAAMGLPAAGKLWGAVLKRVGPTNVD